jgi:hypothetical protein
VPQKRDGIGRLTVLGNGKLAELAAAITGGATQRVLTMLLGVRGSPSTTMNKSRII